MANSKKTIETILTKEGVITVVSNQQSNKETKGETKMNNNAKETVVDVKKVTFGERVKKAIDKAKGLMTKVKAYVVKGLDKAKAFTYKLKNTKAVQKAWKFIKDMAASTGVAFAYAAVMPASWTVWAPLVAAGVTVGGYRLYRAYRNDVKADVKINKTEMVATLALSMFASFSEAWVGSIIFLTGLELLTMSFVSLTALWAL